MTVGHDKNDRPHASAVGRFYLGRSVLAGQLLGADVCAEEGQDCVLSQHAGGDAVPVALAELVLGQIGIDDRGLPLIEAGIDEVVENRRGELVVDLGTQIVNDEKVAGEVAVGIHPRLTACAVSEALPFKIGEHTDGRHVKDVAASLNDASCHGRGQVGLAQTRTAEQDEVARLPCLEGLGVLPHTRQDLLHAAGGGGIVLVVGEVKVLKALLAQEVAHARCLKAGLDEFFLHADTHFGIHKSRIVAQGALVLRLGIVGGVAVSHQQLGAGTAQLLVGLADGGDARLHVLPMHGCLHEGQARSPQSAIDLGHLGDGQVDLGAAEVGGLTGDQIFGGVFLTNTAMGGILSCHNTLLCGVFSRLRVLLVGVKIIPQTAADGGGEEVIGIEGAGLLGLSL